MKEFIVLRRGEPIMFGLDLVGVTWVAKEHIFDKPIEKIGQDLELFWDGKLIENSREGVVRVVAHWKKTLLRRAKKNAVPIDNVLDLKRLTTPERREMLVSIDRVSPRGDRIEVLVLRQGRGANQSYRTMVRTFSGRRLVGSTTFIETTKDKLAARARKLIRGLDFSDEQMDTAEVFGYTTMADFLNHDQAANKRSRPLAKAFA